ncbi:aldo/keto reductase family oxidoreductase [Oceanobacillus sp. J11TS1]|uniref:aldo/keto reductase n=1 Tax=Oceanobacillus sp. J11TS1 TaxID=2807191 RepID=UPI001B1363D6|nr:aldo/keto reductase [Oceanobacillus sp. J11TS1]GIO24481.1 oxidoreductase [Oceanobacillus sp. J11TS1]
MKRIQLGNSELSVPVISLGCMVMHQSTKEQANKVIHNALEHGVNFFDHADIYGKGKSESIFAEAIDMNPSIRENLIIQSKAGIRDGFYDSSKEYLISSVENSLKRLKTDYLDVFLIHRPDALVEPEEVAEAFSELEKSGKVRHFGVSNFRPRQIELLKKYVDQDLIANQLQLSIANAGMINQGLYANTSFDQAMDLDGGVLEYSRMNDMTIQAWSPLRYGFFGGFLMDRDAYPVLNQELDTLAEKYDVSPETIAIAWILRHPANIQTIVGTMTPKRLSEMVKAADVTLTRKEWYRLWQSAGNKLL